MTELTCGVARDLLPLYADNLTGEESRALVEAHLGACAPCRMELAAIRTSLPRVAPKASKSLRRVNQRLRRKKAFIALAAAVAVLAVSLGIMGFATKSGIYVTQTDIFVCDWPMIDVRGNPLNYKVLFIKVPYDSLLYRVVETGRVPGEVEEVHQIVYFTGYETAQSRWRNLRYGKQPFNGGPILDDDKYMDDPDYEYSQPQTSIEGVTAPYPGQELAPQILFEHEKTMKVFFVPYNKWEQFQQLSPFSEEARGMSSLLWEREEDAYDIFRIDSGAEQLQLIKIGRHEAGTPLE